MWELIGKHVHWNERIPLHDRNTSIKRNFPAKSAPVTVYVTPLGAVGGEGCALEAFPDLCLSWYYSRPRWALATRCKANIYGRDGDLLLKTPGSCTQRPNYSPNRCVMNVNFPFQKLICRDKSSERNYGARWFSPADQTSWCHGTVEDELNRGKHHEPIHQMPSLLYCHHGFGSGLASWNDNMGHHNWLNIHGSAQAR